MTFMDDLMFENSFHTSNSILDLQAYIKSHMTDFEGHTFLNWSRLHGFVESERWHPLEQAHRTAADYMISVFDKQKIIDPVLQARV